MQTRQPIATRAMRLVLGLPLIAALCGTCLLAQAAGEETPTSDGDFRAADGPSSVVVQKVDTRPGGEDESPSEYVRRLRRTAERHDRLGYFEEWVGHLVKLGFVGTLPRDVRAVIADCPEGVEVRVGRSIWTMDQILTAVHAAVTNRRFEISMARPLDRGRGIEVQTTDARLLRSAHPDHMLGLDVGIIVRRGTFTPALAQREPSHCVRPVVVSVVMAPNACGVRAIHLT